MLETINYKRMFRIEKEVFKILSTRKKNILAAKISKFIGGEDVASIEVEDKSLVCFFPEFTKYGWNKLAANNQLEKLEGTKIKVFLKLFPLVNEDVKHSKQIEKKIIQLQGIKYLINGEIVEMVTGPKNISFVDCGIAIYISLPEKLKLKAGDWIHAEGRLDAYLVK